MRLPDLRPLMVRQAHHERRKTARPEPVEGRVCIGNAGINRKGSKKVLVLQHVEPEPMGRIATALETAQATPTIVRVFKGEPVPAGLGDAAGLIVMGGPMGVYEGEQYPHLKAEIRLIQEAIQRRKPVLGTCLGSQLLAAALGAEVRKGKKKEIGWYPVSLSAQATTDPLWKDAPQTFTALHWHGDVFDLPSGAISLASSELTMHQAFRYGDSAYGFLFHMEVTAPMVGDWVRSFDGELKQAGIPGNTILAGIESHMKSLHTTGDLVYRRWAEML